MDKVLWQPQNIEQTQMWQFMQHMSQTFQRTFSDYQSLYEFSINEPRLFWPEILTFFAIPLQTPAKQILNDYSEMLDAQWFEGASLNFAQILLRRQDNHPAIIAIDELGRRGEMTYQDLFASVAACAAGLEKAGVQPLDRVAAVMPNVAFTIVAMLATASIGAIWSTCSPDFGAGAILDRLEQIEPKVVLICDGHTYQGKTHSAVEKIKAIHERISSLTTVVVYPNLPHAEPLPSLTKLMLLDQFLIPHQDLNFPAFPFSHPLYILFSSGTTGQPKCIVHGAGGTLIQHIKELGLHCDLKPRDNMLFYTTCGWMMWNWMVSTLALGATLTLYEGAPCFPNPLHLFEVMDREKVSVFGTSAKFLSTLEKEGVLPNTAYTLPYLRLILSTGSPLMPSQFEYVYHHLKSDVMLSSISGGTDILSCFALANPLLPVYSGELQCIGLGMAVKIFNEQGQAVVGQQGELVCTQAFPSMPVEFWQDKNREKYRQTYFSQFPKVWTHGDYAEITPHQSLIIYGRSDATLKPGGVRIGTAEIYRQLENIPEILEAVVIGQNFKDEVRVVLFVKLKPDVELNESLQKTIRKTIRHGASPRHVPEVILQVKDIPHTINGKLVELAVRQVVEGLPVKNLDSIVNPETLNYFKNRAELMAN